MSRSSQIMLGIALGAGTRSRANQLLQKWTLPLGYPPVRPFSCLAHQRGLRQAMSCESKRRNKASQSPRYCLSHTPALVVLCVREL